MKSRFWYWSTQICIVFVSVYLIVEVTIPGVSHWITPQEQIITSEAVSPIRKHYSLRKDVPLPAAPRSPMPLAAAPKMGHDDSKQESMGTPPVYVSSSVKETTLSGLYAMGVDAGKVLFPILGPFFSWMLFRIERKRIISDLHQIAVAKKGEDNA